MKYSSSLTDLRSSILLAATASLVLIVACGDDDPATDTSSSSTASGTGAGTTSSTGSGGATGSTSTSASSGASTTGASTSGTGGGGSCLDDHAAGERFSVGDNCNFCDCNADGTTTCTTRTCPAESAGCTYDGVNHAYGERFPSSDACNECVCAASGLACTRRDCTVEEEGAILMESLDLPCGDDATFTAKGVLDGLPFNEIVAPLSYNTDGPLYPETLPDTTVRVRIVYDGGFAVCRIPAPGQEAFDIEVLVEWITADGAFDEGFHTYLRRNAGGFVDAWFIGTGAPPNGLDGTYNPACVDPAGFGFDATIYADQTAEGHVIKICETDILLDVASFSHP